MDQHQAAKRFDPVPFDLSRRRLLQLAGAGVVMGGFSIGTASAQTIPDLCQVTPIDLVVVLDQSGSMGLETPTRMARAKAGATALVDALNVSTDGAHVAVLTFGNGGPGGDIPLFVPLTDDPATALSAIAGIDDHPYPAATNMEAGVQAAREELTGIDYSDDIVASGNDRPGADKVMVFLTDGVPNRDNDAEDDPTTFPSLGTYDPSEEAASARTVDGIEVFTIGIDLVPLAQALLEDMASDPTATHAFTSVDLAQIETTFEGIAEEVCPTPVTIDVKPGSDTNPINCRPSRSGVVPVALLGSASFDVTTVDPSSLRFGSLSAVVAGGGAALAHGDGHLEDVNDDGYLDLLGHYPVADAGFAAGDTQGVLVGETADGDAIAGFDVVTIVGKCP